jgi:hypothetical protein
MQSGGMMQQAVGMTWADGLAWAKRWARSLGIRLGVAVLIVGGFCLVGSDGQWFPWANGVGVLMFVGALVITNVVDVESL